MKLATSYLGFELRNPFIVGASPMCDDLGLARRLEDCGASMLVMRSIFQEQIAAPDFMNSAWQSAYGQSPAYLAETTSFRIGPDEYLELIGRLKQSLGIPILASLNARQAGDWVEYARRIESAGADALELNIYDPILDLNLSSDRIESQTLAMVTAVRSVVKLPLAVKLSSSYTGLPHFAAQLCRAGAGALVLFNRVYQPEMEVEHLELRSQMVLSTSDELRTRLRAVAALWRRIHGDLAITGGVHTSCDVLRATLVGANAVQMVSTLLEHGPYHLRYLTSELTHWLDLHGYESLSQLRGSMSLMRMPGAKAVERDTYMNLLNSWGSQTSGASA